VKGKGKGTKKSYSMSRDIRDYNFKITKLGLMRFGHLNKGRILFVEQDLHPVDITVNTCRQKKKKKYRKREIRTRRS
jgi:hypothetical protein